jgi:hypothetical protein
VKRKLVLAAIAVTALGSAGVYAAQQGGQQAPPQPMRFFVTSETGTGNLGGVAGADARCQRLAQAAGAPANRTWRAYVCTQGAGAVNARDRIGAGPWHNQKGVQIAANIADLHGDNERDRNYIIAETALDERGNVVPGRIGRPEGQMNQHDIMTGCDSHGRAMMTQEDRTCRNWTSAMGGGMDHAMVGHHDRSGGNTTSWNSAHPSPGCDVPGLQQSGGAGRLYCFATN